MNLSMPFSPPLASSHAASVDHVMTLVHLLMLVLFVGWGTYFVFVLLRFRRARHPRANPAGAQGRFALATEIGVVIAEASTDREEILVGEVSLARIDEVRTHWPFLRDRRIDAYSGIERRFIGGE